LKANKSLNRRVRISTHESDPYGYIIEITGSEHFSVDGDTVRIALKGTTLYKIAEFQESVDESRELGGGFKVGGV
jgi:hypothetical protein